MIRTTGLVLTLLVAGPALAAPQHVATLLADAGAEAMPRLRGWPAPYAAAMQELKALRDEAPAANRVQLSRLLGEAHEARFETRDAEVAYRDALAQSPSAAERAAAQLGLARTLAIGQPAAAAALLATLEAENPGNPAAAAAAGQLRARMAMTAGDPVGAARLLRGAIGAAGRDTGPDAADMLQSLLADLGIALALAGDLEAAAAYTSASGVGSDANRGYIPGLIMPLCDPASGLTQDDAVIFEVTIYGGTPFRVTPVWSKRPGAAVAVTMLGQAIADWRWPVRPQPPVLRHGIRILAACSANGEVLVNSDRRSDTMAIIAWLDAKGVPRRRMPQMTPEQRFAADLAGLAAAEAEHGEMSVHAVPWLAALGHSDEIPFETARGHLQRALTILDTAGAPAQATMLLRLGLAQQPATADSQESVAAAAREFPAMIAKFSTAERNSPPVLALRFAAAQTQLQAGATDAATAGFSDLLAVPTASLAADDPLRRSATVALARIAYGRGRRADGDRLLRDAGFTANVCASADEPVSLQGFGIDDSAFPAMLRRADIDGFVVIERGVAGDGRTTGIRIIYASPPFQFDKMTTDAYVGSASNPPRRAGKPFPCIGGQQPIFWRLMDQERPQ
ncbi:MAG: hypothetical protein ACOYLS_00955 [Polymorphobacter sp.]